MLVCRRWAVARRLRFRRIVGQLHWVWPILSAVALVGQRDFERVCCPSVMLHLLRDLLVVAWPVALGA